MNIMGDSVHPSWISSPLLHEAHFTHGIRNFQRIIEGYCFDWEHAPFNNGSSDCDVAYFDSVKDLVCPEDGTYVFYKDPYHLGDDKYLPNRALAPSYDAARVNWGGSWRMPAQTEFSALISATYWKWDAEDKGYYVYTPDPASDAGKVNSDGTGTYNKTSALLFFPAAGNADSINQNNLGKNGYYWSSYLAANTLREARLLTFGQSEVDAGEYKSNNRYFATPIRPISD